MQHYKRARTNDIIGGPCNIIGVVLSAWERLGVRARSFGLNQGSRSIRGHQEADQGRTAPGRGSWNALPILLGGEGRGSDLILSFSHLKIDTSKEFFPRFCIYEYWFKGGTLPLSNEFIMTFSNFSAMMRSLMYFFVLVWFILHAWLE